MGDQLVHQRIVDQRHGLLDPAGPGRPAAHHLLDLGEAVLGELPGLGEVGLLAEILGHEALGVVESLAAVGVHRDVDELQLLDVGERPAGARRAPAATRSSERVV